MLCLWGFFVVLFSGVFVCLVGFLCARHYFFFKDPWNLHFEFRPKNNCFSSFWTFFLSDASAEHILWTAGSENHEAGLRSCEVGYHSKLPILGLRYPERRSAVILFSTTHRVFPRASSPRVAPTQHQVDTVMQPLNPHKPMPLYSAKMYMLSLHRRAAQTLRTGQILLLFLFFFFSYHVYYLGPRSPFLH